MAERLLDPTGGLLSDVFVEGAWLRARSKDPLDGGVLEHAEAVGVPERSVELLGRVALAQQHDPARLPRPCARSAGAQLAEEVGSPLAHAPESDAELVSIDRIFVSLGDGMKTRGIELEGCTARRELVARDTPQVRGVDEELALRDAHRQDVGDVLVRDGVLIARPRNEAVDAAYAVHDARCVVRVTRQRHEVLLFLGEALERGALVELAVIDDALEPVRELRAHIVEVAKLAAVEEGAFDFPKGALGARLQQGCRLQAIRTVRRSFSR